MKTNAENYANPGLQPRPLTLGEMAPYFILPATVLFNFVLCFINTRVFTISVPMVIACEIVLVGASFAYGFMVLTRAKLYWLMIMALQLTLMLLLSLARDEFLMKPIRDMIIMPVFVVMGLASVRIKPVPLMFGMCIMLAVVAMWEAYFLDTYIEYFNVRRYYVEKGVLSEDHFIPLDLAASGMRPNESYLLNLPFHRLSSVFLEPVSLGFFGFIAGLFFVAMKRNLSKKVYIGGLLLAYFLIVVSDARMAFGSLTIMLLMRPFFARIDHRFAALAFPIILFISFLIYLSEAFGTTGEGIGWRLDDTMKKLSVMNLDLFTGLSTKKYSAEDSGLLKVFQFQGILGVLLYWLAPVLFMRRLKEEPKIYLFGISIFLSFGFMISAAILTIKTAAFLWFLYGYLVVWSVQQGLEPEQDDLAELPAGMDISGPKG